MSLALRFAVSQAFVAARTRQAQFVFLDEPFQMMDSERAAETLKVLRLLSPDLKQFLVIQPNFSEEERRLFDCRIRTRANAVELEASCVPESGRVEEGDADRVQGHTAGGPHPAPRPMPSTEDAGAANGMIPSTLVITGPTASGKGTLAFDVARLCGAEIVSLDSMKVYREVDIATAKPLAARREAIPHHLMDIVDTGRRLQHCRVPAEVPPDAPRDRAARAPGSRRWRDGALPEGHRVSGLAWALLRIGIYGGDSRRGPPGGCRGLAWKAPGRRSRGCRGIDPADLRRIVRALEVIEKTGRRISGEWNWGAGPALSPPGAIFAIERARSELYARSTAAWTG